MTPNAPLALHCWGQRAPGIPVILLHGIGGLGSDWTVVARSLATQHPVIAPDARGHGDSPWSPEEAYHTDAHFVDIATLLDALALPRVILAGYSMGGGVAILTAAALPARVACLVVIDAYPAPEMTPGSRNIARFLVRYADSPPLLPNGRPRFDPAIARHMAADLAAGAPRTDLWPFWDALECPTLLVRGEDSTVLPVPLAREMLARQPHASLETIPHSGHQLPFQKPQLLSAAIAAFATTVPQ